MMYKSKLLSKFDFIEHGFFTRNGGRSRGVFESLNSSFFTLDEEHNVLENRAIIQDKLKAKNHISTLKQTHSNNVFVLSNALGLVDMNSIYGDGLITKHRDIPVGVYTADCVPILLVESKFKACGAIHAGWKGLLNGVVQNAVSQMQSMSFFGGDIYACLGPSIGLQSYEVDEGFYLNHLEFNIKSKDFFTPMQNSKYLFDIRGFAKFLLLKAGLRDENIEDLNLDTCALESEFFSHRRSMLRNENGRGLQVSCIFLK